MNPFRKDDWVRFGKRYWWQIVLVQAVILFAAGFVVSRVFLPTTQHETGTRQSLNAMDGDHQLTGSTSIDESQPQWWTCAMHPQIRQQKPGNCPICQMELVPVQSSSGGMRTLTIKPAVKQLMKVETAPVERKYVTAEIRMVGKVEYDETRLAHITARVSGRLDRLYVDYTGVQVNEGDHMVSIYSEELYSIQEELISAVRFNRDNPPSQPGGFDLAEAAREKLRLLGITEQQIGNIEQQDKAEDHITIWSPTGGIVIEKLKQEGDRVQTGDRIYTVADLTQVWIKLDAYESDLAWLRYGQEVNFTTEAYPGESFTGRIAFIDPVLSRDTRTVKVRVNVSNYDGRLKPEMFVRAVVKSNIASGGRVMDAELAGKWISPMHPEIVKDQPGTCDVCGMPLVRAETLGFVAAETDPAAKPLVIPASAALVTGTRAIVYVEVDGAKEPTYEGREVLLGPRAGDYYLVRNGLFDGERVVTNGNFKIDSALQIQAKPTMMTPEGGGGGGHNHGGESKQSSGAAPAPAKQMVLPDGFRQQLHDLVAASEQVNEQAQTNDLDKVRGAFAAFSDSLNRVNAEGLADHSAMLWKEFLMLLGNDAIEGIGATDIEMAVRVDSSLRNNIRRMRDQFMLTHEGHGARESEPIPTITVSDVFRMKLAAVTTDYFQLQAALAADNPGQASQAIAAIQQSLAAIDEGQLQLTAKEQWTKEAGQLGHVVDRLVQGQDIATARTEFAMLSEQLLVILQRFGGSETDIYELHCPMAYDGRGAIWLQNNDQPANPYFGATMLKCADRVRKIEFNSQTDANDEGHQHE